MDGEELRYQIYAMVLEGYLKQIVHYANEWEANRMGNVSLHRKRWQRLGEIARQALRVVMKEQAPKTQARLSAAEAMGEAIRSYMRERGGFELTAPEKDLFASLVAWDDTGK